MRLADIFQRNNQVADTPDTVRMQVNTGRSGLMNRQIQALIPGQTIQGEIVSRNGSEIQIRLADDMLLNARLDQNMNLEIGKSLAFQIKNNGQSLLLSPLFTNTAVEGNVIKALDMASLPVNQETVDMAGQMMKAGLSVDKNSLQQVFREMNLYPDVQSRDIVDLHRLGLPVNESSVNQIGAYKNFSHQLLQGMNDLISALFDTLESMEREGNMEGAARLYRQVFELIGEETPYEDAAAFHTGEEGQEDNGQEGSGKAADVSVNVSRNAGMNAYTRENDISDLASVIRRMAAEETDMGKSIRESGLPGESFKGQTVFIREQPEASLTDDSPADAVIKELMSRLGDQETALAGKTQVPETGVGKNPFTEVVGEPFSQVQEEVRLHQTLTVDGLAGNKEQMALIRDLLEGGLASGDKGLLRELLENKEVRNVLANRLELLCTASPEEIEDSKSVDALYQRLDRQLKGLGKALESAGQTDSMAYRQVQNLNQNLDFLHQINQVYTYVQLPVRLQQGNAHGDLYVYTNKKNLASKDGQISALLHLDMEHLGPVDVYVLMQSEKVSTRFYVQDDEMLDFLEEHMDILTERLKRRGYDMKVQMQIREEHLRDGELGAMAGLLPEEDQTGVSMLQQYAFDVRA